MNKPAADKFPTIKVTVQNTPRTKPPRWRCRRPGLWVCYWLGKHYATARRVDGGWTLTIFSVFGVAPVKSETIPSLADVRAIMAIRDEITEWTMKTLNLPGGAK